MTQRDSMIEMLGSLGCVLLIWLVGALFGIIFF